VGGDFGVTFQPNHLAYDAFVCDRILFLARLALDYALERLATGDLDDAFDYAQVASRLGRYALIVVADRAAALVHEVGHVFLGGGHCAHDCCFSAAAEAWTCRIRGHLGLPREVFGPRDSGDFNNPDGLDEESCTSCGTDRRVKNFLYRYCDVGEEGGAPLGDVVFYASRCYAADGGADPCR
jgi:hypothetical protein